MLLSFIDGLIVLLFLYVFFAKRKEWFEAFLASFLMFYVHTVVQAEILSIFKSYNYFWCRIWGSFLCAALLVIILKKHLRVQKQTILALNSKNSFFFATSIFILGSLAVIKALTYPPQNFDSMTYHVVRSFLWWKNQSIHNISFSHRHALYFAPLNAICMTKMFIVANGSDYWLNLVQFPVWIVAIRAAVGIADELLIEKRNISWFATSFLVLTPLALFQASTTQNDLMVASFAVITVYILLKLSKNIEDLFWWALLGFAGGLTILSKISGASTIFAFCIAFFVFCVFKKGILKVYRGGCLCIACGIILNIGYWIRNAVDLNGDFLAIGQSYNWGGKSWPVCIKILYNIGWSFGNENERWSKIVSNYLQKIAELLGYSQYNYNVYMPDRSHDFYGAGYLAVVACVCLVITIIISIIRKKWVVLVYASSCVMSAIISAACFPPCNSSTRYMLGCFFLISPLLPWCINELFFKTKEHAILKGILYMVFLLNVINSLYLSMNDIYMSFPKIRGNYSYEQLRTMPYYRTWDEPRDTFIKLINDNGYCKIGIIDNVVLGEYPLLYQLKDKKYVIDYIDAQWGKEHAKKGFIPDCILVVNTLGEPITEYEYVGHKYSVITNSYNIIYGTVTLLEKID